MITVGSRVRIKKGKGIRGEVKGIRGATPVHFVGQECVVKYIEYALGTSAYVSSFLVRLPNHDSLLCKVYPDEVEEIAPVEIEPSPPLCGRCNYCRETLTPHKGMARCKHEIYVCCECRNRSSLLSDCAACQTGKKKIKSDWNIGWNHNDYDYPYD